MKRLQQQGPPELSIGLIESAEFWMPKVLATFKAEFSYVHNRLLEVLSLQDVEKALTHFHVHLAITNQYINNKDMQTISIYDEKHVTLLQLQHQMKKESYV